MTKSTYPTKYQLEHLKKRINSEIDPLIDQAELSVKSIIADLTESAELKLAKKIKADVVIKELEDAIAELEIKQRKAQTFFGKIKDPELRDQLNYKFNKKDRDSYQLAVKGINLTRKILGNDQISALMTTTKLSLKHPIKIIDEYNKVKRYGTVFFKEYPSLKSSILGGSAVTGVIHEYE